MLLHTSFQSLFCVCLGVCACARVCGQNEALLSRLFRHPNLLTSRLVFSSCCQLWVLSPLMSYGTHTHTHTFLTNDIQ